MQQMLAQMQAQMQQQQPQETVDRRFFSTCNIFPLTRGTTLWLFTAPSIRFYVRLRHFPFRVPLPSHFALLVRTIQLFHNLEFLPFSTTRQMKRLRQRAVLLIPSLVSFFPFLYLFFLLLKAVFVHLRFQPSSFSSFFFRCSLPFWPFVLCACFII